MKPLLRNKHSQVNGQRSLEIRALLPLWCIGVVGAARKVVTLLPSAYSRGVVCVGAGIYVL